MSKPIKSAIGSAWWVEGVVLSSMSKAQASLRAKFPLTENELVIFIVFK